MKKIAMALVAVLLMFYMPAYGQGFFKKISKGLENVNKELDKALGTNSSSESISTTETANINASDAYKGVMVKSFDPKVAISLISCIRDGNRVIIEYSLTNNGDDLTVNNLGTRKTIINPDDETLVIDSQGKRYEVKYNELGVDISTESRISIPTGIRLKGVIEISGVSPAVKQFQLINMAGLIPLGSNKFKPFSYSFKNIPIFTLDETLAMLKPTVLYSIDSPSVSKTEFNGTGIKSVVITDKYTRVDCFWKNTQFDPEGSIFMSDMGMNRIEIDGKKYMLTQYAGMGIKKDNVYVKYNQTGNFTYIFEPIPANTKSFDLYGDEFNFLGVSMIKEVDVTTDLKKAGLKGNVKTVIYKNGRTDTDTYKYNENGMLISVDYKQLVKSDYPQSGSIVCAYNEQNLLSTRVVKVAANGQINYIDESLRSPQNCTYSYDQNGRLIKCYDSEDKSTTVYEYNSKGQLYKEIKTAPDKKFATKVYEYNDRGNMTASHFDKISKYPNESFKYDNKDRVIEYILPQQTGKLSYNDKGDIAIRSYDDDGDTIIMNYSYTYDAQGNWTKSVCKDEQGELVNGHNRVIEYYSNK